MEKIAPARSDGETPGRVASSCDTEPMRDDAGEPKEFELVGEVVRRLLARLRKGN